MTEETATKIETCPGCGGTGVDKSGIDDRPCPVVGCRAAAKRPDVLTAQLEHWGRVMAEPGPFSASGLPSLLLRAARVIEGAFGGLASATRELAAVASAIGRAGPEDLAAAVVAIVEENKAVREHAADLDRRQHAHALRVAEVSAERDRLTTDLRAVRERLGIGEGDDPCEAIDALKSEAEDAASEWRQRAEEAEEKWIEVAAERDALRAEVEALRTERSLLHGAIGGSGEPMETVGRWVAAALPYTAGDEPDPALAIARLDETLSKVTAERGEAREQLALTRQAAASERERHTGNADALRARAERAEAEAAETRKELDSWLKEESEEVEHLRAEDARLRARVAELETERTAAIETIQSLWPERDDDPTLMEIAAEVGRLVAGQDGLEGQLSDLGEIHALCEQERDQAREDLAAERNAHASTKAELARLEGRAVELEAELEAERDEARGLRDWHLETKLVALRRMGEAVGAGEGQDPIAVATERMAAKAAAERRARALEAALGSAAEAFGLSGTPLPEMPAAMASKFTAARNERDGAVLERASAKGLLAQITVAAGIEADLTTEEGRQKLTATVLRGAEFEAVAAGHKTGADTLSKQLEETEDRLAGVTQVRDHYQGQVEHLTARAEGAARRAAFYEHALAEALDKVAEKMVYDGAPEPLDESYAWWLLRDANPYRTLYLARVAADADEARDRASKASDVPF